MLTQLVTSSHNEIQQQQSRGGYRGNNYNRGHHATSGHHEHRPPVVDAVKNKQDANLRGFGTNIASFLT